MGLLSRLAVSNRCLWNVYETRWLPSRRCVTVVEECELIAPAIPARLGLAGEQFEVRAGDKPFDPLPNAIRLPAVFAAPLHD